MTLRRLANRGSGRECYVSVERVVAILPKTGGGTLIYLEGLETAIDSGLEVGEVARQLGVEDGERAAIALLERLRKGEGDG